MRAVARQRFSTRARRCRVKGDCQHARNLRGESLMRGTLAKDDSPSSNVRNVI